MAGFVAKRCDCSSAWTAGNSPRWIIHVIQLLVLQIQVIKVPLIQVQFLQVQFIQVQFVQVQVI